ncbi:aminoacyl-tRNA deacylase [Subtercola frigoramans]|uniref:Cys-tRNA(Pro) deacylase n=1 Tax=Subtercola frigoramans TaxID=120298 RepID=A0ABS2L4R2_9MICO|nr:YbaK/EbsC family protein [Subtercola frigoramans]MBM7472038.1 Cys-tRNA(Pro) deacylase [Subtercola frigoramans]
MPQSATERVDHDARARGLTIEIVERPPANSLEEAAALLGLLPSDVVKSLVVKRHDGDYLFALVPGDRQISWSKLRALLGVNKLSLPSPERALEATGYERGTITPLGSTTLLPVIADERMLGKRIALGAGAPGHSLLVDADALLASFDATIADITDPLQPRD